MSTVILAALGFGYLSDGSIGLPNDEFTGEQWGDSDGFGYTLADNGDGRKWMSRFGNPPKFRTWSWSGETEIYFSCRVYRGVTRGAVICSPLDGANRLGSIGMNDDGEIVYSNNQFSTYVNSIVATSVGNVLVGTWAHIEVRVIFHNSTGSVKIWINGILDSDTTGIDTIYAGTSCTKFIVLETLSDAEHLWGDIVIHNDSAPLGDVGVYYIPPDADGVDADFTPSAGIDNYAMVDEIGSDGDTTYNESDGTAGHRDSLENGGIADIAPISVGYLVRARNTAGGAATIIPGIVHSGSEDQGAARTLSESYAAFEGFMDDVPGGAGWTLTQIGNAEVSYEVGA